MLDLDKLRADGGALWDEAGKALGAELPADLVRALSEAALGETGMELHKLTIYYGEEADRCRAAGGWFAACLMMASAIEGLLTLFCILTEKDVKNSTAYLDLSKGDSYEDKIFHATFEKLIKIATELTWVPSQAVDTELLEAAVTDFPQVVKNLFPTMTLEAQIEKIKAFESSPGIEMLRILQYLRNLIHAPRCRRLKVSLSGGEFESDCKFAFVIGYEVMSCLFAAFTEKAQAKMGDLSRLVESLSPNGRQLLRSAVSSMARK